MSDNLKKNKKSIDLVDFVDYFCFVAWSDHWPLRSKQNQQEVNTVYS